MASAGCWSFLYERWASGLFFTQTKPPAGKMESRLISADIRSLAGPFWDKLNEEMFSNLSFHTIDPEKEERMAEAKKQAADEELADKIRANFKASEEERKLKSTEEY